jgi:cation:H+ antiporter
MSEYPLWLNAVLFAIAAATIWQAGARLERYASTIAYRIGMGEAFGGMLLLAASTSLPELATTITAIAILDNPTLAIHNLLGGVAFQTAILAIADRATRKRGALTFFSPSFVLLIEGVGLVMLLQLAIAGIAVEGEPTVGAVSVWLILLAFAYLTIMYLVFRYREKPRWTPTSLDDASDVLVPDDSHLAEGHATKVLWLLFAATSTLVLGAGWLAAQTAEVLAEQTGLGSAFLGATLLAAATSLPELSTTIAATRNGRHTTAISNVFGSNAFDVTLLLLADLLYRGGTVLEHGGTSLLFVAAIGSIMTCVYLWGLMERENRAVLGVGWDSAAAVLVYAAGMSVLYFMG